MPRLLACVLTAALATHLVAASDERRITTASNVRLRSAPMTTASITAELPLATELVVLEHTNGADSWDHVRSDDGRNGWVLRTLTSSLDPERREQTIESIVRARLSRTSQPTAEAFSTRLQL